MDTTPIIILGNRNKNSVVQAICDCIKHLYSQVFQRRQDGSVDFYKSWTEYRRGFGHVSGEHWLGMDRLLFLF